MAKLNITTCPSCGSKRIQRVRRNETRKFEGHEYTVPNLEYYECPGCGEKSTTHKLCGELRRIHQPSSTRHRNASRQGDSGYLNPTNAVGGLFILSLHTNARRGSRIPSTQLVDCSNPA